MPTDLVKQDPEHKRHRSPGNHIFDLLVYPSIAFGAVFAFSIWALHSTKYGTGAAHRFFEDSNKWIGGKLEHIPLFKAMPEEKRSKEASNYAAILVSFATGTILISPIKWFEDRRDKISQYFDRKLGIEMEPEHYKKEPRQSWKSVYGGRAITFASVLTLGTAVGEKRTTEITQSVVNGVEKQWKKFRPQSSAETLKKVRQWTDVSAFETFYTALCAVLVYGISRTLASTFNKRDEKKQVTTSPEKSALQGVEEQEAVNARSSWQNRTTSRKEGHAETIAQGRLNPANPVAGISG